jgi:hypothetical protein
MGNRESSKRSLEADGGGRERTIDLIHNDVTRLDAREECWS